MLQLSNFTPDFKYFICLKEVPAFPKDAEIDKVH